MAVEGYISHDQFPGDVCVRHLWTGENVGEASGQGTRAALAIHRMMVSEGPCPHKGCPGAEAEQHGHYLNLIDKRFRYVGIGLDQSGGTLWLTEDFVS